MPEKVAPLPHISRIDRLRTRGWLIRFIVNGQCASCLISDSVFGGKAKARSATIKIRNQITKKFPAATRHKAGSDVVTESLRQLKDQLKNKNEHTRTS